MTQGGTSVSHVYLQIRTPTIFKLNYEADLTHVGRQRKGSVALIMGLFPASFALA